MLASLFNKKTKRYLALDIGSQNTKMIILRPGSAFVERMIMRPTPSDRFQMGSIIDETILCNFLSQSVAELIPEEELNVVTGVSGKGVIAKKIDIPQMEKNMIPEFVEIEAEQELFYNRDEMELDYEILNGVNFNEPEAKSLLVITVLKQIIKNYNNLINKLFTNCQILLDTNFSALFNSFEYNEKLNEDTIYMVLDIGSSSTDLVILIKNQVVFTRNLPLGGDFFNQGIQKKMGVDYQEAEELKISASNGLETPQELASLITNELNETFLEELSSCYELYNSFFPKKDINCVYITGGASQTLGLIPILQNKLGCPVKFFNPFKNIKLSSDLQGQQEEIKLYSAVITGLALRSIND